MVPRSLARVPVDTLFVSIERLCRQGGKAHAVKISRLLVKQVPGSGRAHRALVRSLLTNPVSVDDVFEARSAAEVMVRLWDDVSVSELYVETLIHQIELGVPYPDLLQSAVTFAQSFPERRIHATRRLLNHLATRGDHELTRQLSWALAKTIENGTYLSLALDMMTKIDDFETAGAIFNYASEKSMVPKSRLLELEAKVHLAKQCPQAALEVLSLTPIRRTAAFSAAYVDALSQVGKAQGVLDYLDTTDHGLAADREVVLRFNNLWLLGERERAVEAVISSAHGGEVAPSILPCLLLLSEEEPDASRLLDHVGDTLEASIRTSENGLEQWIAYLFLRNKLDEILLISDDLSLNWKLTPNAKYSIAKAAYVRRDFDRALKHLMSLETTIRRWEAQKLYDRILLETGHASEAISRRKAVLQTGDPFDEVIFFARLQLGDTEGALETYLEAKDRDRLRQVFNNRAEFKLTRGISHRFIIAMNGPGDELQWTGLLPIAKDFSERVSATCDPRLHSLYSRSFPGIEFFPVSRIPSRPMLGVLSPTGPPRSDSVLFDLLTNEAESGINFTGNC